MHYHILVVPLDLFDLAYSLYWLHCQQRLNNVTPFIVVNHHLVLVQRVSHQPLRLSHYLALCFDEIANLILLFLVRDWCLAVTHASQFQLVDNLRLIARTLKTVTVYFDRLSAKET